MSVPLASVRGLAVDAQATGASPSHGELLEVGWASLGPSGASGPPVRSCLVRPLRALEVPRRVERLTGIATADLRDAVHPRRAWRALHAAAESLAPEPGAACLAVVHFARFEEPFLRALHREVEPDRPFPLELICTHELARRLLPKLPRKGLRAVAGYFGHDLPELKRSGEHVAATILVWRELLALLEGREGIRDLCELREWLSTITRPSASRDGRSYPMDPELVRDLPDRPGVYRMRRESGDLLYVGKARSLRRRVQGYFRARARHPERTLEMLTQARRLEYTVTETGVEAALVEADEIKGLRPRYNVALRERGRQLAFWSMDLLECHSRPDRRHPLGPFPSPESLARLSALLRWIGTRDMGLGTAALGVPPPYAPAPGVLREGLRTFIDRHELRSPCSPASMLRLGARLHRQEASPPDAGADGDVEPTDAGNALAEEGGRHWSPELVAEACEECVAAGARLVRRAHWLCGLAESSVAWSEGGSRWLLAFSRGRAARPVPLVEDEAPPIPPGHARSERQRQSGMDLHAHDQLSVLTRELKALVASGTEVKVRLGPEPGLAGPALARRLRGV